MRWEVYRQEWGEDPAPEGEGWEPFQVLRHSYQDGPHIIAHEETVWWRRLVPTEEVDDAR